jgi:hypothetical protein
MIVKVNKFKIATFFYSNCNEEDREAERLLKEAGIPCSKFGPTLVEETPTVEWGFLKYVGIEEIKDFIGRWKKDDLPSPYGLPTLHQFTDP